MSLDQSSASGPCPVDAMSRMLTPESKNDGTGSPAPGTDADSTIRVDPTYQLKKGETVAQVVGRHITLTMDDF